MERIDEILYYSIIFLTPFHETGTRNDVRGVSRVDGMVYRA